MTAFKYRTMYEEARQVTVTWMSSISLISWLLQVIVDDSSSSVSLPFISPSGIPLHGMDDLCSLAHLLALTVARTEESFAGGGPRNHLGTRSPGLVLLGRGGI